MYHLQVEQLEKRFGGNRALGTLSLAFEPGITGIVGPNGSGKTTLAHVLTGVYAPSSGTLRVGGAALTHMPPCEAASYGITRTFQSVRLFNQMTVLDNVLVVLTERSVFSSLFERHQAFHLARAEEVLRRVGLWDKRKEQAGSLSYGQRKLLEVARALAMRATVYIFDEPFAGLFPAMISVVSDILRELKEQGCVVLLIEHNMELIRRLTDRVVVLEGGTLLAEGPPGTVLARPDVLDAYLGN